MKKIYTLIIVIALSFTSQFSLMAQDCELSVSVYVDPEMETIPASSVQMLSNTLTRIATSNGIYTDNPLTQFVITANIDQLEKSALPGPPMQFVNKLGVTLYLADIVNTNKYASVYLELKGVGKTEEKSFTNALSHLNGNNPEIKAFIINGKKKIIDYYNKNYSSIIAEAERKANMIQLEEALAMLTAIPVCSNGGNQATEASIRIYIKHRDRINEVLYNRAHNIWAASQDKEGAMQAGAMLAMIDPDATCYPKAVKLAGEIKNQVKSDIDFEVRVKHQDKQAQDMAMIETIKAVGVAYGNGQQPQTFNIQKIR